MMIEYAEKIFRKAEIVYVQPVAMGVAQILRSRTNIEKLDACLKAAEIVTRYLAGLSLASYARRAEEHESEVLELSSTVKGSLSWGTFLEIVQRIHAQKAEHPAKSHLSAFKSGKKNTITVEELLVDLLNIRNKEGHSLNVITAAQAGIYLNGADGVVAKFAEILGRLERVLCSPLFIVEETRYEKKCYPTRLLWLMGQSPDPEPVELVLHAGVEESNRPYVAIGKCLLEMWPFFAWDMIAGDLNRFVLLQIDKITEKSLHMKPIEPVEKVFDGALESVSEMLKGQWVEAGSIPNTVAGEALSSIWAHELKQRLAAHEHWVGELPWQEFDDDILRWYAEKLEPGSTKTPQRVIAKRLFDSRKSFEPNEIKQARLLFGTEQSVAKVLSRDIIDLRSMGKDSVRWDERVNKRVNVLTALRCAVDFFSRHIDMNAHSMDDLTQTNGSAYYLAMREALVNLFIHQDYGDEQSAAQVELKPKKAMFANQGYSLVSEDRLVEGGKSQARNPLIARALRIIGFAELAGSGLRALSVTWRTAKRRPPVFDSDKASNCFTLTLDWRPIADFYDSYWKERIGVKLTSDQASILNLACDPQGTSLQEVSVGTGQSLEDAQVCISYLTTQRLVEQADSRIFLAEHLRVSIS